MNFSSWLDLIIILFSQNKEYTIRYVKENQNIKIYFMSLLSLWAGKNVSEVKEVLEELLS